MADLCPESDKVQKYCTVHIHKLQSGQQSIGQPPGKLAPAVTSLTTSSLVYPGLPPSGEYQHLLLCLTRGGEVRYGYHGCGY